MSKRKNSGVSHEMPEAKDVDTNDEVVNDTPDGGVKPAVDGTEPGESPWYDAKEFQPSEPTDKPETANNSFDFNTVGVGDSHTDDHGHEHPSEHTCEEYDALVAERDALKKEVHDLKAELDELHAGTVAEEPVKPEPKTSGAVDWKAECDKLKAENEMLVGKLGGKR